MASTSWPHDVNDWRGRFILDLHQALTRTGEVALSLWAPPGVEPANGKTAATAAEADWLRGMSARGGIAHLLRNQPLSGLLHARGILSRLRAAALRVAPDLYHVNWLQLALGLPDDGRPAFVSALGSDFGLLRLPGMTALLRRSFARRRVVLAPNAEWMLDPLRQKFADIAGIEAHPFGVNAAWFDIPRPATAGEQNWLVVSRVTRHKLGELPGWGEGLFDGMRRLQLLGPLQETISLPAWVHYLGPTDPQALRDTHFPRAAGLLTLSRHDEGRPQILIEAMAAGLPVIASRIAAHADLIRHGETGWLVDSRDELIRALEQAEDPSTAAQVSARARTWVRERIGTWDDCARRCLQTYNDLLEGDRGAE